MKAQKYLTHSVCHITYLMEKKLLTVMSLVLPQELNQERKMKA